VAAQDWIKIYDGEDGITPKFCAEVIRFFEESTTRHKLNQPWQRYHQLTSLHQSPIYERVRENIARIFDLYKRDVACGTLNYVLGSRVRVCLDTTSQMPTVSTTFTATRTAGLWKRRRGR